MLFDGGAVEFLDFDIGNLLRGTISGDVVGRRGFVLQAFVFFFRPTAFRFEAPTLFFFPLSGFGFQAFLRLLFAPQGFGLFFLFPLPGFGFAALFFLLFTS